eukprot:COSAG03_NODE_13797_length_488_cov_0.915167_1_plen_93_part_00
MPLTLQSLHGAFKLLRSADRALLCKAAVEIRLCVYEEQQARQFARELTVGAAECRPSRGTSAYWAHCRMYVEDVAERQRRERGIMEESPDLI